MQAFAGFDHTSFVEFFNKFAPNLRSTRKVVITVISHRQAYFIAFPLNPSQNDYLN